MLLKTKVLRTVLYIWVFGFLVFFMGTSSFADNDDDDDKGDKRTVAELQASIDEKEDQLSDLEAQKKALAAGRSNIQAIVNNLRSEKKEMTDYVTELDAEVTELQGKIDDLNAQVEEKEAEIAQKEIELEEAQAVADAQYDAMKERIRFIYESGESMYIELLLNADSFGDLLNKTEYIEELNRYDRNMLDEYRLVIQNVELCRNVLDEEKEVLEETRAAAEEEQENINVLIGEKKAQIDQYSSDIAANEDAIAEYDAEIADQNAVIAALEAQVAADKAALDEATKIHFNGGAFAWPAPSYTRISDPFGWRMHPTLKVQKFHNGVDLAAPGGSPILAAYDGKVVAAAYSSSMGNYIMIDHGDGLYTIYMHASALYVSKGQTVSKAQKIAAVGSTGRSTGNHLHFGVRLNGNYVDPMGYL